MSTDDARLKIAQIVRELGMALHALDQIDENSSLPAEISEQSASIRDCMLQVRLAAEEVEEEAAGEQLVPIETEEG